VFFSCVARLLSPVGSCQSCDPYFMTQSSVTCNSNQFINSINGNTGAITCGTPTGGSGNGSTQWANSGSNIYYSPGNVGIDTANPTAALSVTGNTSLNGATAITGNTGIVGATTVNGTTALNGATTVNGAIMLNGATTINGVVNVSGNTLTGLVAPINPTDAATKAYVDAAGSSTYSVCYVLNSNISNTACASGYTMLFEVTNGSTNWTTNNAQGSTNAVSMIFGIGGSWVMPVFGSIYQDLRTDPSCSTTGGQCIGTSSSSCDTVTTDFVPGVWFNGYRVACTAFRCSQAGTCGVCCK
jgi:hypothetical protein